MSEMNKQNILDQLVSAFLEVDMLNNRAHEWRMTIPARVTDSDVVISNALHQIKPLIEMVEKLRAERDAAYKLLRELHRNFEGINSTTPANVTSFKAETAYGLIDQFLAEVDRRNAESAAE